MSFGPEHRPRRKNEVVGEVGLEPTKAKPADLQSAPFAARDTPPFPRRCAADENAPGDPRRDRAGLSCAGRRDVNWKMTDGLQRRSECPDEARDSERLRPDQTLHRRPVAFCDFDRGGLKLR